MTDEELIARLRKADEYEPLGHDGWEAADRIEALTEQLAAAHQDADEAEAYAWKLEQELGTCRMAQAVMDNTVADLEAKLAKAVEGLEELARLGNGDRYGNSFGNLIAQKYIAELEGRDDE